MSDDGEITPWWTEDIAYLERKLAAALAQRDKAREDALEEAAQVCDELRNKDYSSSDERWVAGTDDCATAIRRAMKECGK
jgi:F0F1-type ATP synthase membrane subunit b/b'